MTSWLINLSGLAMIALIVWWFWLKQPKALRAHGTGPIEILVKDGVYSPARIEVPVGLPVTLRFIRQDPSPCAEKVVFDDFGISTDLPVNKPHDIFITPTTPGEHEFTCQMRMYRGRLVVRK